MVGKLGGERGVALADIDGWLFARRRDLLRGDLLLDDFLRHLCTVTAWYDTGGYD
ncbi:hypothetical protein GCM10023170_086050 [Phytohabitans houttuyneae]|uniref:Uncharacterized protein n=1 Tax=Phytohabitans houttuyneae TaxID=1076126 RepID=A0A6V8K907_9ACTN|nr:hypothetical protein Phou_024370 [Phytohabitans houttuyneae]